MKRFLTGFSGPLLCISLILGVITNIYGYETIETSVTEVTVYRQGAQVKRVAEISVPEGTTEYIIQGLSPYLNEETLQVKVEPSNITVLQSRVFDTYLREPYQKRKEVLVAEIKRIEKEIALKEAQISSIETTIELAKKRDTCGASLKQCLTETGPVVENLFERKALITSEIKVLQDKKSQLEKELQGLGASEKTKALSLVLDCPEDIKNARVTVLYFVERAKWWPYYILSVDTLQGIATVRYLAEIQQNTNEDWQSTSVVLSTSMPFFWGVLPEPEPWTIDLYKPLPPRPMYKAMPLMEAQREPEKVPQVAEERISFSITLPEKMDISSGPEKTKAVAIASAEAPVNLLYRAYPASVERVFLEATLKNPFHMPMFQGPVTVFVDGSLTNRLSLNETLLPGTETKLALGVDPSMNIKRRLKRKYIETKGLFTKKEKVRYEYEIEIINGKSIPVELTLQDRVPLSQNEQIEVQTIKPSPEEAKISEDGIITWNLKLMPGEKRSIPVIFTVSYPKGERIIGLP